MHGHAATFSIGRISKCSKRLTEWPPPDSDVETRWRSTLTFWLLTFDLWLLRDYENPRALFTDVRRITGRW